MTGHTDPLTFPYPTGTDRVADGDNAIQALAEALDDFFVGENLACALSAGVGNQFAGNGTFRRGRMVTLRINAFVNPIAANGVLMTVDVAHRPAAPFQFVVYVSSTGSYLTLSLEANGTVITYSAIGAAASLLGHLTYPLGSQSGAAQRPANEGPDVADEDTPEGP